MSIFAIVNFVLEGGYNGPEIQNPAFLLAVLHAFGFRKCIIYLGFPEPVLAIGPCGRESFARWLADIHHIDRLPGFPTESFEYRLANVLCVDQPVLGWVLESFVHWLDYRKDAVFETEEVQSIVDLVGEDVVLDYLMNIVTYVNSHPEILNKNRMLENQ